MPLAAARREIQEETGLLNLEVLEGFSPSTATPGGAEPGTTGGRSFTWHDCGVARRCHRPLRNRTKALPSGVSLGYRIGSVRSPRACATGAASSDPRSASRGSSLDQADHRLSRR
ncbi:hypothetical protein AB0P21_18600 [Kribbella sp. NPDC056861]|uniref:hypothetical protein n=1 Tax=Kribbella sp. NPDC056861 TaxID=3154857 RepID=UPI003441BD7A